MYTEFIEYPTAAEARSALVEFYGKGTHSIDIIGNGKTLRLTHVEEPVDDVVEEDTPLPDSEDEDDGEWVLEDIMSADRSELIEIVALEELDIEIPANGALAPQRAKVAAALGLTEEE